MQPRPTGCSSNCMSKHGLQLKAVADILDLTMESTYTLKHRLVSRLKARIEALQKD